jgi:erythromycin esterase
MTRLSHLLLLAVWMVACSQQTGASSEAASSAGAPASTAKGTLLEGVVRNASGEPVAEALVSLVSETTTWNPLKDPPAARVRTAADGRFRIEGVPAGGYAMNVTAPGLTTRYRTGLKLEVGQPLTNEEVRLEPKGVLLQGLARKRDGTPVPEAWVGVARISNDLGDIAYTRADAKGAWSVQMPPGDYMLYTDAPGHSGAVSSVKVEEGTPLSQDVYLDNPLIETPPSAEVVELLKKAAVPLSTVEAGHGFEDLRPLAPWVAGARVVALGEATHGSREFFQLKHRMLEWLATEHGFTVFGIEANFAEALAINTYVLTGKGDPAAALAGLYFWTWDTEEVLALLRWMRAYNADPKHTKKLKFYGFDMQYTPGSTKALQEYLKKVDPALARKVAAPLAPLLSKEAPSPRRPLAPAVLAPLQASLAEVQQRLESQRAAYVKKSSAKDHAFAVRHAELLVYLVNLSTGSSHEAYFARDRIMAENVRWLLEQEGPEAKMVAWAHNGHVTTANALPFISLGKHLRETMGDALYVFGFAFNQGSFQAMHMARSGEPPQGLITHTVPPARPGTLDASLASVGLPLFALNMRGTPKDSPLGAFFQETRWSRNIGAVYGDNFPEDKVAPGQEFDGLLFVEKTSAATSTPTGRRPPPGGAAPAKSAP